MGNGDHFKTIGLLGVTTFSLVLSLMTRVWVVIAQKLTNSHGHKAGRVWLGTEYGEFRARSIYWVAMAQN